VYWIGKVLEELPTKGDVGDGLRVADETSIASDSKTRPTTSHIVHTVSHEVESPDGIPDITSRQTIIIDAIVDVQQVAANPGNIRIGSCSEFAAEFLGAVERKTSGYDAVHLVFDHYDQEVSLKQATRERRKGETTSERSYACSDTSPIRTSLTTFLQSSKTKDSLTRYLGRKVLEYFRESSMDVMVSTQA
jgi:hypothetical protein